ncbi:energy-coupling factor transporter ATPase [Brevibacillus humidisoli]|uniref:energy-coupling factor transporter ATPase n=1 Tax=Brevibacillus humidisoli TaxID=2895522 RepID=UPI001E47130C|nr:energy-coupling factor transporter ATPase [Brevibacillus humidisoli]UFJ40688.1 energy-coupling factor transporter ATPase [Brevibacillus humidisoli]
MNQTGAIVAKQLSFRYGEGQQADNPPILNQLNLAIRQGSFVSIIGPNGSGKSTLARLLNVLLLPSEGVLIVCGVDTSQEEMLWEIRRQVGMVFQNPDNQIVAPTVEDDVAFGLENLGVEPGEMEARIDEALRSVQMEAYATEQPHRLSGGQKQRVAIAGVIAMRPSVIIFDEATAMLDPKGRREVISLAHRLHREEGITMINITHFPEETVDTERVIVMHQGQVYADGTPAEVFADPVRLREIGLEVPYPVRLRHELARHGVSVSHVLHQDELVEELCRLLLKM